MSAKYKIALTRWAFDPMQREAAELAGAMVMKLEQRVVAVGHVEARLNTRRMFWDISGPGVREAYAQAQRVHYRKAMSPTKGTYYEYHRADDDMMAAVEDAVKVIAVPPVSLPKPTTFAYPTTRKPSGVPRI